MFKELASKTFSNGIVYALETEDGFPIEVTDTFLPYYTKNAAHQRTNKLQDYYVADRSERWMIGVSCMSGCPVRCKFCATGKLPNWRSLTTDEIVNQVEFIIQKNKEFRFVDAKEHKINYTRMGEPFLNINNIKEAITRIDKKYPGTHHYISTIGIRGSSFGFIKDNITLQISVHSLNDEKRNWLIPYNKKMTLSELGSISTKSNLKTTVNLTLVEESDFNIDELKKYFDKEKFFIKLSPINPNEISEKYNLGNGVIEGLNLI